MNEVGSWIFEIEAAGVRTTYYERGTGPVLLLLHGMFGDISDWETVLEPLSTRFRVITPDLPGFGHSDKPDAAYDAEFFLTWLGDFLRRAGIEEAAVVGNSFGGEVAILWALAHPDRVSKLGLVSSGGLRFYTEEERTQLRERFCVENLKALTPAIHEWMFRTVFAQRGDPWRRYLAKQDAKLKRAERDAYATALHRSMLLAFDLYFDDELKNLQMPVLLMWGDGDVVFPVALAERALEKISDADLVILEGAGHAPQLENPEGFVTALERFMGSAMHTPRPTLYKVGND